MCKSCHTALWMVNEKKHTFTQNSDNASAEYTLSSDEWTCTCCHSISPYKRQFLKFNAKKYNHSLQDVSKALMHCYVNPFHGEFIC